MMFKWIAAVPRLMVLAGNGIGPGVMPMFRKWCTFVYTPGQLNQAVAATRARFTLMAAALPLACKEAQ